MKRRTRLLLSATAVAVILAALPGAGRAQSGGRSFTIAAGGDILIHQVISDMARLPDGSYDFRPLLMPVEPWISEADLAICHMEGTAVFTRLAATSAGDGHAGDGQVAAVDLGQAATTGKIDDHIASTVALDGHDSAVDVARVGQSVGAWGDDDL